MANIINIIQSDLLEKYVDYDTNLRRKINNTGEYYKHLKVWGD